MLKFTDDFAVGCMKTYFILPSEIEGFIIKEAQSSKVYYVVKMLGHGDISWMVGDFDTYADAEKLISEVYSKMNLQSITDIDKIKEEILNGKN